MQTHDWILLAVGMFIGAPVGMLVMGLCISARNAARVDWGAGDDTTVIVHSKAYYDALDSVSKMNLTVVEGDRA